MGNRPAIAARFSRLGAATLAIALCAAAGSAAAQPTRDGEPPPDDGSLLNPDGGDGGPDDAPPDPGIDPETAKLMAKKLISGGDEFFKKGDYYVKRKKPKDAQERYERALAAYSKAFELVGNPQIYFPMASAEDKLERWLDAANHYHRFLSDAPDADPGLRDQAAGRLENAKLHIGMITLTVQPEGAAVAVDGNQVGLAPLPEAIFLAPGDHALAITADGYQPSEQTLAVEAGSEAERTFELEPVPAVIVDTAPPPPPPPAAPRMPPGPSKLPLILGGGVTVGLVGGAVATGLMAVGRHDTFTSQTASPVRRENARTEGKTLALVTDLMIAGSVVAAGVTTYYYLKVHKPKVRAWERRKRERLTGAAMLDAPSGPKLLVTPWVETSGPGTAAGLVVGGAL